MIKKAKILNLIFWTLLFTGCVRKVTVLSDVYSDKSMIPCGFTPSSSFAVVEPMDLSPTSGKLSGISNDIQQMVRNTLLKKGCAIAFDSLDSKNPLLDKEVKYKIEKILTQKGYRLTHPDVAEYIVCFLYDINLDTKTVMTSVYIPGPSVTTTGTVVAANDSATLGSRIGLEKQSENSAINYTETTQESGTISWVPIEVANNTSWLGIVVLNANELKRGGVETVWNSASFSTGQDNDLRDMINYLLVPNWYYFGQSTSKQVSHKISEKDETYQWICN